MLCCLAPLDSKVASKCWNGMSQGALSQVTLPLGSQCRVHRSHLLPGTDTGKTVPVRNAGGRIRHPPAYQQVPPEEAKREQRRSDEMLHKRSPPPGSSGPGCLACPVHRTPFQALAQPHSRMEISCSCICRCKEGKAGRGISTGDETGAQAAAE